ncbi:cell surface protein SprA [Bacteroidota bacterium]
MRNKYVNMGFKLFLFPFFILIIVTLSGFSKPQQTQIDSFMLFDACFGYVNRNEVNTPDFDLHLLPKEQTEEISLSSLGFITALSDSNDTPDSSTVIDSTLSVLNDSSIVNIGLDSMMVDSLRINKLAIDSTARLNYFRFQRNDVPYLRLKQPAKSKFFAYPSQALLNRSIQLDSTGQFVIIREEIAKGEYREYLKIPLEDFIAFQLKKRNRDIWEEIGSKYEIKSEEKEFGQLLSDITNIEIPLPSSSIFSIFGPPKINIRINGAVDIHGAWRNETTEGVTVSALGNTRNEPDFKQKVQINVSGTIGDKLTIAADWNTERTFQYENQLKLKYTGYEDEIIQSIEAGNVSLQTSPLVGGSEALFGIKSHFQMGPFSLTAIASQKKGEIQEVSLNSGAQSQKFEIHAYDYSQNHYFLDAIYADPTLNIFNKYYGNPVPIIVDSLRVKDIEVWKTITGLPDPNERTGNAYIDLRPRSRSTIYDDERDVQENKQTISGEQYIRQRFVKLNEGADYILHPETGFVTFSTQIQAPDAIAVAYRIEGPTLSADDDIYYGEFLQDVSADTTATIVLKLIKPQNLRPGNEEAWKLQLRNIYPVGGRDVKEEGFALDVHYIIDGQEPQNNYQGTKLLESFGLDKTDQSGTSATPDGAFDFFPGRTIFPFTGEIVFPVLEPFGDQFPVLLPDTLKYNAVYDTTVTFAKQDRAKDKFIMVGEYSAAVSSVYSIGFNVVENSVRVTLNGRELIEGIDYSVDYNIGQITIRNDQALVPGADLKISYEQNDLFQLASKTLLGLRGIYEFNKDTRLGFSLLDLNQQTLSDKVRIGEEPLNNMILGADFETKVELPFITKGLDQLISTKEMSTLTLKGEYAYMSPDPNTKKSKIEGDNGASIAYIDDFEGAKRIIPVGINYSGWKDLSVPNIHPDPLIGNVPTNILINSKARSYWFNILPSDVTIYDIWGDRREAARENTQVTVLNWDYDPNLPGFYNWNPDLFVPEDNWGGMMTKLSSTANNLIEENIEFIEFWIKIIEAPANAKIYVDLGQISEDVIPNQRLDTEDINQNDLVDEGEDTGLDGLLDLAEPNYDALNNPDPSLDNYEFLLGSGIFSGVNGTQGNAVSLEQGRLPDTEDMNRNFTLDLVDSYFRYEVPVDTLRANNPLIAGGGDNAGWYLIRIPLKDHIDEIGDPTFSVVESIRFMTTGISNRMHVRLAEINLVGNQWQKVIDEPRVTIDDEVLSVSTINVEDNPEYVMPPGLERERDRSETEATVFKNEQSLRLVLNDLDDGDNREVVKYLFRPLDLFNYKEMKLYVHGDLDTLQGSVSHFVDENNHGAEVYFRFGADSLNFYEYRQPVRADWNEIRLLFSELTAIKQSRPSDSLFYQVPLENLPGHFYGVRGKPTLTRITFFTIGILNPKDKGLDGERVSGEIWINELRVLNADDTPGWAYTASTSLKLADLLNVNFNISQTDPYFHKLAERFGSRVEARNWGVSADLDVLKLFPVNLSGSNLHVGYQRSESMSKPLYVPGTDISVDQAVQELEQKMINEGAEPEQIAEELDNFKKETETKSVSETWTVSNVKIKIPSDAWYIKHTINSLTLGYNYNRKSSRNPTTSSNNSWIWNANIAYALNLGNSLYFSLADIPIINYIFDIFSDYKNMKVFYTPQTFNLGLSASRRRSFILSRNEGSESNIQRDFTAIRNAAFSWKFTEGAFFNWALNYNLNISSSLAYLLIDENENERDDSEIWSDILGGAMFGRDYDFKQSFDLKTRPMLPTFWNLNRHIIIDAGYNASYNWRNNFQQEELGKSAGFNTRFSTSLSIKWKDLFAPLFEEEKESTSDFPLPTQPGGGRGENRGDSGSSRRGRDADRSSTELPAEEESVTPVIDTTQSIIPDSLFAPTEEIEDEGPGILSTSLNSLKLAAKYIFFDYDQFRINFSQNNSNTASGLEGAGTGFNNFWGLNYSASKGPSRAYMLGLSRDPGPRAPFGNLSDNFSQKNQIDFSTKRSLWEGAEIDLNWNVSWGITKSTSMNSDSLGNVEITNITSTGTINRSFFTVPPVFFLSFMGNGIKKVAELYNPNSPNPNMSLANAFVEGFESLPILSKIPFLKDVGKYIPRPNWTFNWTGLEKISFFNWAKKISINHAYISNYSEGWKVNPDGLQEIQTQRIEYGFSPLIGLNISFDEVFGGNLTSNIKFSSKTAYNMGASTKNVTETFSRDIAISASYSRSGFEFPLFGVSLKNDLEISFSYTSGKNSVVIFLMDEFSEDGKPQDGTTRTIIEPRIKYVMSSRVTLSLFYRRTSVEPEGAARIPPTTTNEAGLDVHISIQ